MIKISCDTNIKSFMYKKFPEILREYLLSSIDRIPKERLQYLNKLLKDEFKIPSLEELIDLFVNNLVLNTNGGKEFYILLKNIEINKVQLESIIRAVDYGNSVFPASSIFNTALIFVNNNLEALYKYSYLGVN